MKILAETRRRKKLFLVLMTFFSLGILWAAEQALAADKTEDEVSGKESITFEGKESSDVRIRKGVTVTGTSPAKAVINGDVTMENGSVLKNVTINAKIFGITVEKDASVVIENVTVKKATSAGIYTKQGGGTLTIRNSRITQNQKGFYILPGKNLAITGNQVTGNKEEGIDIRRDTSGVISGNTVTQNGEGGGEIIVNGASLTISRNTFSQNRSSGLALQVYSGTTGKSNVADNTFSGNGNFGVDCKNPQGSGSTGAFKTAVSVRDNMFSGNAKGTINRLCGLLNVDSTEETEKEKEAEEVSREPQIPFEEEPSRIKEIRLEKLGGEIVSVEGQIREPREYLRDLKHYIYGNDRWYFSTHHENLRRLQEQLGAAKAFPETERLTEMNALFPGKIVVLENKLAELAELLDTQEHWSPWGRQ